MKKLYIYENNIMEWSLQHIEKQDLSGLTKAFEEGDCETASDIITGQLMDTISFYDYKEDYYHGFIAGLIKHNGKYLIKSNRESGLGRYDLALKTKQIRKGRAIILEFKVADNIRRLEKGCKDALGQIEKLHTEISGFVYFGGSVIIILLYFFEVNFKCLSNVFFKAMYKIKNTWKPVFPSVFKTGPAGFEPTGAGVKVLCLTAWRWPNVVEKNPCC